MPAREARAQRAGADAATGPWRGAVIAAVVLLVLTIALVVHVRLRLAGLPLERDEGEYALAGQLILNGVPPYEQAYNMKFPGTYYAFAAIMAVFGQTASGIRIGLLLVHLVSVGLLFGVGRRLIGTLGASLGAAVFALLAVDRGAMGVFAHATHFVLPFAIGAFWLLVSARDSGRAWQYVSAGALMGFAIVMKQQALPIAIALLAVSAFPIASRTPGLKTRGPILVSAGIAIALAALAIVLAMAGVLGRFWFWTFQYASAYVSGTPASVAFEVFGIAWSVVARSTGWLWYLGLAGLMVVLIGRFWRGEIRLVLAAWFAGAAASVATGFFFRPHYFILAMPIAGLLAGALFVSVERWSRRGLGPVASGAAAVSLFVAVAAGYIVADRDFWFRMDGPALMRSVYATNPFLESPEIARYIAAHTSDTDRIAVLGSEPQIAFYARRRSATGYIYMYPLTERHALAARMQDEMIAEIEAAHPAFVVLVEARSSWVATLHPDMRMATWARAFVSSCYERVGVVDIHADRPATILWDSASAAYEPQSSSRVLVYRRTCA
jgi:hypothetical protein